MCVFLSIETLVTMLVNVCYWLHVAMLVKVLAFTSSQCRPITIEPSTAVQASNDGNLERLDLSGKVMKPKVKTKLGVNNEAGDENGNGTTVEPMAHFDPDRQMDDLLHSLLFGANDTSLQDESNQTSGTSLFSEFLDILTRF